MPEMTNLAVREYLEGGGRTVIVPVGSTEDHGDHGNDLYQHLKFAQIAGLDGKAFGRGNAAQSADQEFAPDDDDRDPRRHQAWIELDQSDECRRNQHLVGKGIEQDADGGDLAAPARNVAVDSVGDGCCDEKRRGQQLPLSVQSGKTTTGEHPDE
jgi:hypothetical protein